MSGGRRRQVHTPEGLDLAGAKNDVHPLGQPPLDPLELVRVEGEPEYTVRLDVPRELRVPGLLRERAERGGLVGADQEIGDAPPVVGREDVPVDDLRAGAELLLGAEDGFFEAFLAKLDLDDLAAFRAEPREESGFVPVALAADELSVRVLAERP